MANKIHGRWINVRVLMLMTAVFTGGCASILDEEAALTTIPYRVSDQGQLVVDVMVNDQGPFKFALDTGASISVVFDEARELIGIPTQDESPVYIHGMVGSDKFPVALIDNIQVGSETWRNVRVASLPGDTDASSRIDGILGVDFLARYAIEFSVNEHVVRLFALEQVRERSYQGWASIPLRRIRIGKGTAVTYAVELNIGDTVFPALLDLGANHNVMNWLAARSIGVRPVEQRKKISVSGVIGSAPIVAQLVVRKLRIANVQWRDETFLVAESPVFMILGLDDRPLAIVGAGLFHERDLMLDLERDRLLIRVAKALPASK